MLIINPKSIMRQYFKIALKEKEKLPFFTNGMTEK